MDRQTLLAAAKRKHLISQAKAKYAEQGLQQEKPLEFIEEMHPDITYGSRAVLKNLASDMDSPEAFEELKRENPGLEFVKQGGRFLAKRPEETEWRVLDPDKEGFDGFGELARDAGDVAWDIGSGVAETAATAGSGILGALATPFAGGAGAIPAAMAGGAGAGNLTERFRQYLGDKAGIENNVDEELVSDATKFGAVSPLLLGTGAAGKNILKLGGKYVTQKGGKKVLSEAGKKLLQSQSGLTGQGLRQVKKALPALGQAASSVPKAIIKHANENIDDIGKLKGGSSIDIYEDATEEVATRLKTLDRKRSKEFEKALNGVRGKVDVAEAFKPMDKVLKKYEDAFKAEVKDLANSGLSGEDLQKAIRGRATYEELKHLKKVMGKYRPIRSKNSADKVYSIQKQLADVTKIKKEGTDIGKMSQVDMDLTNSARQTAANLKDKLVNLKEGGKKYKEAADNWGKLAKTKKKAKKYFADREKAEASMDKLTGSGKNTVKQSIIDFGDDLGMNIRDYALDASTTKNFLDPQLLPGGDIIKTGSKTIPLATAGTLLGYQAGSKAGGQDSHGYGLLGGGIGALLGAAAGGPRALRMYMKANKGASNLVNKLQNAGPNPVANIPTGANVWNNLYNDN